MRSLVLALIIFIVSLITAVTAVLASQIVMRSLGLSESIANPIALLFGLVAIGLSEWLVRRWWNRRLR